MNTPAPAPHHHEGFHGKSSGAILVKAAIELREGYEEKEMPWTSRRMHYWTFNPAENRHPHVGPYVFPESDLLSALIALYFDHVNLYYPLLHRPTFERSIADGLHTRDGSFGAVVLLVCAIASGFSDDVRVCPPGAELLRVGWQYFDQHHRPPLRAPRAASHTVLLHTQSAWLAVLFLEYVTPSACWTWIGIGILMAQDVGVHRARSPGQQPTVESELWKRAFWLLFQRRIHMGKPSRITFFNCLIRLNIHVFTLKILYGLNKTEDLLTVRDNEWEEHAVAELDSALNGWVDSIPSHRARILVIAWFS
ncbi:hypothetical protein C8R44DRAFT_895445 [Mycena epipterygia]|nr:hypothetical protein C8R44DRAFT_895445 [Mycena epipterygia]